ncbi:MAG: DUF3873 family protein [Carboxydocellales bacterium]
MTKLTKNGVTTTQKPGQFQCERHYCSISRKEQVHWDYRDTNGRLHTGVAKSEAEAQEKAAKFGYKEVPAKY